ncbi:MAG: YhgE/Pip family protein [Oscillospiraceae bacterium]|nr:YhgE/Pip family protein [Oscillospiraceae bacterium]
MKKFFSKAMPFLIVAAVMLVPLLYSALYLGSVWDPYARLADLPVAIVNEDRGAQVNGARRCLGDELCENLKANGTLRFVFTGRADAEQGTKGNAYYAAVYIPGDFTECIASAATARPKQAGITYTVNEKRSFLAGQILRSAITEIKTTLQSTVDGEIVSSLTDGVSRAAEGASQLDAGAAQLDAGIRQYTDGVAQLVGSVEALAAELESVVRRDPLLLADPNFSAMIQRLSAGGNTAALAQLKDGAAQLKEGAGALYEGTQTLSGSLAAAQIGEEGGESPLVAFAKAPVAVLASPVYPVQNYGTGFAPYFISLSLWVGALVLFIGVYLDTGGRFQILSSNTKNKRLRALGYIGIGLAESTLLGAVMLLMGLHVNHPLWFFAACWLFSLVCIAIMQVLIGRLKDVGKFIAIILLIFQLTSSGGTFPMHLEPRFFNLLYPFMPMTYSVNLFKEAISGDMSRAPANALVLLGILALCLALNAIPEMMAKRKRGKAAMGA